MRLAWISMGSFSSQIYALRGLEHRLQADPFILHLYAALAEKERTLISERTKAGLQAVVWMPLTSRCIGLSVGPGARRKRHRSTNGNPRSYRVGWRSSGSGLHASCPGNRRGWRRLLSPEAREDLRLCIEGSLSTSVRRQNGL